MRNWTTWPRFEAPGHHLPECDGRCDGQCSADMARYWREAYDKERTKTAPLGVESMETVVEGKLR